MINPQKINVITNTPYLFYATTIKVTGLTVADAVGFSDSCSGVTDFVFGDAVLSAAEARLFGDYTLHSKLQKPLAKWQ